MALKISWLKVILVFLSTVLIFLSVSNLLGGHSFNVEQKLSTTIVTGALVCLVFMSSKKQKEQKAR